MSWVRWLLVAIALCALPACGGGWPSELDAARPDGSLGDAGAVCAGDSDGDSIPDAVEGAADPDGDDRPALYDDDSDGDGANDGAEAGDLDCTTPPVDTDSDGTPDFLDRDANQDFVDDADQHDTDLDGDGLRDALDLDVDGDSILNRDERGPGPDARDTDHDGTPDVLDIESDSDGIPDRDEAGDLDPRTPPVECEGESDPATGLVAPDGAPDFADLDRDDDGLADGEELAAGTSPCDVDTDADGSGDLEEVVYQRAHCLDPMAGPSPCGCALSAACRIPPAVVLATLPEGAIHEATIATVVTVRRADVFFAIDTTASMGGTLANVRATIAQIVDGVAATIPDAWVGGGQIEDFPFSSYGGASDRPFALAIGMAPASRTADVGAAFDAIALHGGGDGPEAHTEALRQILTGAGGSFRWDTRTYDQPAYAGDCVAGTWGAPCFREGSLPVMILFTDTCSHDGPSDDDRSACTDYAGISPSPAVWDETVAMMRNRGVTFIGVNAAETIDCDAAIAPDRLSPCWFLRRTAIDTSSIDVAGAPLVLDLPNASDTGTFAATIVGAVETAALRVPRDVDAVVRTDLGSPLDVTQLVASIGPACDGTSSDACWLEPAGTLHEDAVERVEASTFIGVVPGTEVRFRLALRNDVVPGTTVSRQASGRVEVRADGSAVLDTIELLIAIPADDGIAR